MSFNIKALGMSPPPPKKKPANYQFFVDKGGDA